MTPQQIVKEYGPLVTSIAYRMIPNSIKAGDAVQEAWLEILKSLATFKGHASFSTWIYTIASRTILRYIKKEKGYTIREMTACYDKMQVDISVPSEMEYILPQKNYWEKYL